MDKTTAELMENQANPTSTDQGAMAFSQPVAEELPHGQAQPVLAQASGGQPATTPQGQPMKYFGGQQAMNPQGQPMQYFGGQPAMNPQGQPMQYFGGQPVMTQKGQPMLYFSGQPATNQQGQPMQYFGGQPVMTQQGQPMQSFSGQPVMTQQGQPMQSFSGQPTMTPQRQPMQVIVPQQVEVVSGQPQPQAGPRENLRMNTTYLKSGASAAKVIECVFLIVALICIDNYITRVVWIDEAISFFRGIAIFCVIIVIILQLLFTVDINTQRCVRLSRIVLVVVAIQFLLSALMISASVKLALRANEVKLFARKTIFGRYHTAEADAFLLAAIILGLLVCPSFLEDIHLFCKLVHSERAKEEAANQQNVIQLFPLSAEAQPAAPQAAPQAADASKQ